jgi:hypothetical protein
VVEGLIKRQDTASMDRQSHHSNHAGTFRIYSLISIRACDLLTCTSTPYAAAWYRTTNLTFSDAIGAVRLQLWVGDITLNSPPHQEPRIIPPARLVRMANALCFATQLYKFELR